MTGTLWSFMEQSFNERACSVCMHNACTTQYTFLPRQSWIVDPNGDVPELVGLCM